MTRAAQKTSRPIQHFSAAHLGDEAVAAEDTDLKFANPSVENAFLEAAPAFNRHMRNKLFDFDGLHLGIFEFAPSLPLALHKHTGDCVYYIERGSIVMGNREIHAGDGFLVPDSHPYGYVVGPEGVRLIEFSQTPRCDITILDRDITNWTRRLEKAVSRLEAE